MSWFIIKGGDTMPLSNDISQIIEQNYKKSTMANGVDWFAVFDYNTHVHKFIKYADPETCLPLIRMTPNTSQNAMKASTNLISSSSSSSVTPTYKNEYINPSFNGSEQKAIKVENDKQLNNDNTNNILATMIRMGYPITHVQIAMSKLPKNKRYNIINIVEEIEKLPFQLNDIKEQLNDIGNIVQPRVSSVHTNNNRNSNTIARNTHPTNNKQQRQPYYRQQPYSSPAPTITVNGDYYGGDNKCTTNIKSYCSPNKGGDKRPRRSKNKFFMKCTPCQTNLRIFNSYNLLQTQLDALAPHDGHWIQCNYCDDFVICYAKDNNFVKNELKKHAKKCAEKTQTNAQKIVEMTNYQCDNDGAMDLYRMFKDVGAAVSHYYNTTIL